MKNTLFLKRMIFLTNKLCNIYQAEPLDQDALYRCSREIYEAGKVYRAHRRKDIIIPILIILGLLGLAWLVYSILF